MFMCEGVVLLNQWKQGNTRFRKTISDPIIKGSFFLQIHFFYLISFIDLSIPYAKQKFDEISNELLSKYFQYGSIIAAVG